MEEYNIEPEKEKKIDREVARKKQIDLTEELERKIEHIKLSSLTEVEQREIDALLAQLEKKRPERARITSIQESQKAESIQGLPAGILRRTQVRNAINRPTTRISMKINGDTSPDFLNDHLVPYLKDLSELQNLIDEMNGRPKQDIKIIAFGEKA